MKINILVFIILLFHLTSNAQSDTEFWFAGPDVSSDYGYDRPIILWISSFQQPCKVVISLPALGSFVPKTYTLLPNTTISVDLTNWIDNIECKPGNTINNGGIKIESDNKISAYYEVNGTGDNPEMFSLKGKNALGMQFFISSQYFLDNNSSYNYLPVPYSSFNIVATQDNTIISINPTKDIVGHSANIPFTITLNTGQTYGAIAASQLASQHLEGSYVSSNKPIAITLADDLLFGNRYGGGCADLIGDQTVPINVLGNDYIAFKSDLNSPFDKIYVLATVDGTSVNQDGVNVANLNKGQSTELSINNFVTYIQASSPVYVYELSGSGCEVGSAILPKINCTGSTSVSVARSTAEPFVVSLLVKNGGQSNFLVNGISGIITAGQFNVVPNTGGQWYAARISLPLSNYPNGIVVKINNTTTTFQMGVLQGNISGASFGYFTDFNILQTYGNVNNVTPCEGTQIQLMADSITGASYKWSGPNNFQSNFREPFIDNIDVINSGKYILNVSVPGCGNMVDTVKVLVHSKQFSTINKTICEGETFQGYSVSGSYVTTYTASTGCDSDVTLKLQVNPKSFTTINKSICEGESYLGYTVSGTYTITLKNTNSCDSIVTLNLQVNPKSYFTINKSICEGESYMGQNASGSFQNSYIGSNGCDSIVTLNLFVNPKSYSNIDTTICLGQSYLGYTEAGLYTDTLVSSNGCDSIQTINLKIDQIPQPNLNKSLKICTGEVLTISPGSFLTYLWQDGSTNSYYNITKPGIYSVSVTNICGSSNDSVIISEGNCKIYFPNAFSPNNDGKNDIFNILNASNLSEYHLRIYNRWGLEVFESYDFTKGWDGKTNGINADQGTYVWFCDFIQLGKSNKMKGTVVLIR